MDMLSAVSTANNESLRIAAQARFQLDRPALLRASAMLAAQCHAASDAARLINSESLANVAPPPPAAAALYDIVHDLSWAGRALTHPQSDQSCLGCNLGYAVAKIFALASREGIDVGAILAAQLHEEATTPIPF
ncbi:MAG: hypothetical protein K2X55_01095 [Burkholderiaceae bacterium]|nr:hypothetical protein [Burkholderiaceae bacterium]